MAITGSRYATNDSDQRETNVSADSINYNTQMPFEKRQLENGVMFKAFRKYTTVGAGGTVYVELRTGSTKTIKGISRLIVSSGGPINVNVYENPTITTPGVIAMVYANLNRNSVITSSATLFINPTGVSGGTLIEQLYFPAVVGTKAPPLISRPIEIDMIYKVNTTYIAEITNNDTGTSDIYYEFKWIEEII